MRRAAQLGLVVTIVAASGASGQNALGDGHALDGNPGTRSGGRNSTTPAPNFSGRNLLITGNVAAGRGFRGTVGYTAPGDFRGVTGSDDLYEFQAASALSQLAYMNPNSVLRAFEIGQLQGLVEVRRATYGSSLGGVTQSRSGFGTFIDAQARLDQISMAQTGLSGFLDPSRTGELLAVRPSPDGSVMRLSASALRGIQLTDASQDSRSIGLTGYDQARILEDVAQGIRWPIGQAYSPAELTYGLDNGVFEVEPGIEGMPSTFSADYEAMMGEMARRFTEFESPADPSNVTSGVNDGLAGFTDLLAGGSLLRPLGLTPGTDGANPAIPGLPGGEDSIPGLPGIEDGAVGFDPDILRHDRTIDVLTPETAGRFTEILSGGEEHLGKGDYFAAELDFIRALRYRPNHPLALAGLANAQLGAGVQASAAITIRSLFIKHPQMIDVKFGDGILPRRRLDDVIEQLRLRLDSGLASSSGSLLLAYIGHQTDQLDVVKEGIDLMTKFDPDDPLIILLRGVWLEEDVTNEVLESFRGRGDTQVDTENEDGKAEDGG